MNWWGICTMLFLIFFLPLGYFIKWMWDRSHQTANKVDYDMVRHINRRENRQCQYED